MKKFILIFTTGVSLIFTPYQKVMADTYWKTGGAIGAGVLGAVGGVAGLAANGFGEANSGKEGNPGTAFAIGLIGGGAIGFGIGAGIGAIFKKKSVQPQVIADPETGTYGVGAQMNF